jgi:cytochrome P450
MAPNMKVSSIVPDAMPPGLRGLAYGAFCWLNRHPGVLRAIGALLRIWPSMAGRFGQAACAGAVKGVLKRPESFSNTAHEPNMFAGDYIIAMDPGPTYAHDRAVLLSRLNSLNVQGDADKEAARLAATLAARTGSAANTAFDLIDDYLIWVTFQAIQPVFGTAADKVAAGVGGNASDQGLLRQYILEIRYVAGQLLGGGLATLPAQRRANVAADCLRARMTAMRVDIETAWNASMLPADLERNAVGMAWISHPVTVQSGALVVQELLSRPKTYRSLREMAKQAGATGVWTDCKFRDAVRDHVLELMRFRPVFPLLARNVPRDTAFETGGRKDAQCHAGGRVGIWSIAALFDSDAVDDSRRFCPHRKWRDEELRWLMFGYGDRHCPARHYAVEIITSALIGLLTLPELQLTGRKAITYDGALMSRMGIRFARKA